MNYNANKCIECTVQQCAHHCDDANYCSLERILVGTHESNPAMDQCTDCKSFRKKQIEYVFRLPQEIFCGRPVFILDGWQEYGIMK